MSIDSIGNSQIITSITEWIGIGTLTITTGVLLLFGNNIIPTKNANKSNSHRIMETKVSHFTLIGILSIVALLAYLAKEKKQEKNTQVMRTR